MTNQPKKDALESELAEIEAELQKVTNDFDRLKNRGKQLLVEAKGRIDDGKLSDIRKRLGISK